MPTQQQLTIQRQFNLPRDQQIQNYHHQQHQYLLMQQQQQHLQQQQQQQQGLVSSDGGNVNGKRITLLPAIMPGANGNSESNGGGMS